MGVASLVLGIIAMVIGWIPFICFLALILAVIGLILGIVDTTRKNKNGDKHKGISIAGLVISAIAIPTILIMSFFSLIILGGAIEGINTFENYDNYYDIDDRFDLDDWYYHNHYNTIDYQIPKNI